MQTRQMPQTACGQTLQKRERKKPQGDRKPSQAAHPWAHSQVHSAAVVHVTQLTVVLQQLVDEINVREKHSSAAIPLQAEMRQRGPASAHSTKGTNKQNSSIDARASPTRARQPPQGAAIGRCVARYSRCRLSRVFIFVQKLHVFLILVTNDLYHS
jgi:hypothetical protein